MQAVPISLATTLGISVDFCSCSYLDVSVRHVRLATLCIQVAIPIKGGFPHSEICGSKPVCWLPAAYRKLLRPSSPDIAKASTMCTYSLVPITLASARVHEQKPVIVLLLMSMSLAFAVSKVLSYLLACASSCENAFNTF